MSNVAEALTEAFIQGGTFGLSNVLGITGKGGLIHDGDDDPENQEIKVDETGITFQQLHPKRHLSWKDIVEVVDENGDGSLYRFELRGGLIVGTGWIVGNIVDHLQSAKCCDKNLADLDAADVSDANLQRVKRAASEVEWMIGLSAILRASDHLSVNETYLLNRIVGGYSKLCLFKDAVGEDRFAKYVREEIFSSFPIWIRDQLSNITDDEAGSNHEIVGWSLYFSRGNPDDEFGVGIEHQRELYGTLRNAHAWGIDLGDIPARVLTSTVGNDVPLGDTAWNDKRKFIVCTGAKGVLGAADRGMSLANTLVLNAQDIHQYNSLVSEELKLKFALNHPQEGCVYVQHPLAKNQYIAIDEFTTKILEDQYDEMIRILLALGATRIECTLENADENEDESSKAKDRSARAGVEKFGASVSGSASHSTQRMRTRTESVVKKLSAQIDRACKEPPHLPSNTLFLKYESRWQTLAEDALKGQLRHVELSLSCKQEYSLSDNEIDEVAAGIEVAIPSVKIGFDGKMKDEVKHQVRRLSSVVWHYGIDFGDASESSSPRDMAQIGTFRRGLDFCDKLISVANRTADFVGKVRTAKEGSAKNISRRLG